ncbi:MAG: FAD-binding protein, partial [Gammaproteobacteria bacterium]|nr:FAD-binding protein [Gammaproteobacteria bacterium]
MAEDRAARLIDAVRSAGADGRRLTLVGAGSKAPPTDGGDSLAVAEHAGVLDYRPEELVLTARGGTPLADIQALLSQHRQQLPFEPPMIGGEGTLGGAVATGWSGPGRPWRGAVRDAVLGVEMI